MRAGKVKKISESFVLAAQAMIRRCRLTDSSLLISWMETPGDNVQQYMFYRHAVGQFEVIALGTCSSHLAMTAALNSVSLVIEVAVAVSFDTPASAATASMLVLE